jgi:processive 1,2-diacylglycerol beta-glucosyltransferase
MLGRERPSGRLRAPLVTYLTDPSVHSLWVHPGVDLHLALHPAATVQTTRLLDAARHRSHVALVEALVPATYDLGLAPPRKAQLRRLLGVATDVPLLVMVGCPHLARQHSLSVGPPRDNGL